MSRALPKIDHSVSATHHERHKTTYQKQPEHYYARILTEYDSKGDEFNQ